MARRVRHLYLHADFLLGYHEPEHGETFAHGCLSWVKKLKLRRSKLPPGDRRNLGDGAPVLLPLQVATEAIVQCKSLTKITITNHDQPISSWFTSFLSALWNTAGYTLQEVCIHASHTKIPLLLAPISDAQTRLPNLSSFELTIMSSWSVATSEEVHESTSAIARLLESFKTSLTFFSLTPHVVYDMSPLFDSLKPMPNLKRFDLLFVMCDLTFSKSSSLFGFLSRQSHTLEHLVLDQRPPQSTFFPFRGVLGEFLSSEFTQLKMPNVHTFQVGSEKLPTRLVPDILPNLRSLSVDTRDFNGVSASALPRILDSTSGALESLDIRLHDFTTESLDLLATRCPQLRRLTVGYTLCTSLNLTTSSRRAWYEPYSSRRYPEWPLEYVRLGYNGPINPEVEMMDAVAQTLSPRRVEKDAGRRYFR
jgi:hypothetical protein